MFVLKKLFLWRRKEKRNIIEISLWQSYYKANEFDISEGREQVATPGGVPGVPGRALLPRRQHQGQVSIYTYCYYIKMFVLKLWMKLYIYILYLSLHLTLWYGSIWRAVLDPAKRQAQCPFTNVRTPVPKSNICLSISCHLLSGPKFTENLYCIC